MAIPSYPILGGGVSAAVGMGLPLPERMGEKVEQPDEGRFSTDFLAQLTEQVQLSEKELLPFREQSKRRQEMYAGHGYGDNSQEVDTPFNVYNLALRIYQRRLIGGEPKANVRCKSPEDRPTAYEMSLACEQLFREIELQGTMKDLVHQAMDGVGIVKVGVVSQGTHEIEGFLHDKEQAFCDVVLLEDFAFDTNAKRWEEIDWCGNRYRVALDELIDNPEFDQEVVRGLQPEGVRQDEDLRQKGDEESVKRMGLQDSGFRDDLRKYVTVWDIWLPAENVVITVPEGKPELLRVVEYDGVENGPYFLLCFDTLPGNILPVAIGSHLESMAKLINRAIRKLGNQLDRQKTNQAITPTAQNAGDDTTIHECMDGDVIVLQDPNNTKEIRSGGVDQQSYAFTQGLMSWYNWLGGNFESVGGLASRADTAMQQEMELSGASGMLDELADKFNQFLGRVMQALAYYEYTDKSKTRRIVKRVLGTDREIPAVWEPRKRQKDFFLFEFEVDPFSLRSKTPDQRLKQILDMIPRVTQLAQAKMLFNQVGDDLDTEALWSLIVRYTGDYELLGLIQAGGQPIQAAPSTRPPSANVGGMPREYIRRNVSSGGGSGGMQGPQQQALEQMMAAGRSNDQ
jgi:hypothetical protein